MLPRAVLVVAFAQDALPAGLSITSTRFVKKTLTERSAFEDAVVNTKRRGRKELSERRLGQEEVRKDEKTIQNPSGKTLPACVYFCAPIFVGIVPALFFAINVVV
jgi:hypothetical protein